MPPLEEQEKGFLKSRGAWEVKGREEGEQVERNGMWD